MIEHGSEDFEEARVDRVFNRRLTSRQPAAIVRPTTEAEVVDAVRLARDVVARCAAAQREAAVAAARTLRNAASIVDADPFAILSQPERGGDRLTIGHLDVVRLAFHAGNLSIAFRSCK